MKWYYVENGQQAGPVEETDFPQLERFGKLRADTLVWHEGMANWEPYSAACPKEFALTQPVGSSVGGGAAVVEAEAVCAECGGVFNKDDMIPHGSVHICAHCKPVFMQKLAEGVNINTVQLRYAGFWIRFAAKFVDGLILGLPLIAVILLVVLQGTAGGAGGGGDLVIMLAQLGFYVINMIYTIFFLGKYGATPGKMLCKIKVVTAQGEKISYGRATGRFFAEILSGLICYIGYIMAAFDKEKRTLHDHICTTRVVYK